MTEAFVTFGMLPGLIATLGLEWHFESQIHFHTSLKTHFRLAMLFDMVSYTIDMYLDQCIQRRLLCVVSI